MRFWGGQWVRDTSPAAAEFGGNFWRPPTGATTGLDLRSPSQCAEKLLPLGYSIFVTPNAVNLGIAYDNFGTDPGAVLSGVQKLGLRTKLGLPNPIAALDLRGAIWETMTIQADPTGGRCLPIVPNLRRFELHLGGQLLFSRPFVDGREPESLPALDLLKRNYLAMRDAAASQAEIDHCRRVLGYWTLKYGMAAAAFLPAKYATDTPLAPTTTINDNFNRADPGTSDLGTSSDGNWSWVRSDTTGAWNINASTEAYYNGGGTSAVGIRANIDLSSADHYAQNQQTVGLNSPGPCTRAASAAETFYYFRRTDASNVQRFKCVAATFTSLGSDAESTAVPHTLKGDSNGSSHKIYVNGTAVGSPVTDTAITGNLRTGMRGSASGTGNRVDDYQAADLAAGETITMDKWYREVQLPRRFPNEVVAY